MKLIKWMYNDDRHELMINLAGIVCVLEQAGTFRSDTTMFEVVWENGAHVLVQPFDRSVTVSDFADLIGLHH